jgi:hypothetical protein
MLMISANQITFTIKVAFYFSKEKKAFGKTLSKKRSSLFRVLQNAYKAGISAPHKLSALFFSALIPPVLYTVSHY